jgi:hypothetical protein
MSKEADLSSVSSATRNLRFRIYSEVENICAEKIQNALVLFNKSKFF